MTITKIVVGRLSAVDQFTYLYVSALYIPAGEAVLLPLRESVTLVEHEIDNCIIFLPVAGSLAAGTGLSGCRHHQSRRGQPRAAAPAN